MPSLNLSQQSISFPLLVPVISNFLSLSSCSILLYISSKHNCPNVIKASSTPSPYFALVIFNLKDFIYLPGFKERDFKPSCKICTKVSTNLPFLLLVNKTINLDFDFTS